MTSLRLLVIRTPFTVLLSISWLVLLLIIALSADLLTSPDDLSSHLDARLEAPAILGDSSDYILGTDQLGRDMFSLLILSLKTSMLMAFLGTSISAILGTILGMVAASSRGLVENIIMMFVDIQSALPFIIIAMSIVAFFGNQFWLLVAVVGVFGWERYARITRGMALAAREEGYVAAALHIGASPIRIYTLHILPNILSALLVAFTLNFPETLLLETTLSFLGLGIQPPQTSLGTMLGEGRNYLATAWWIAVFPGITIAFASLSASLIGDWLRDLMDPQSSKGL